MDRRIGPFTELYEKKTMDCEKELEKLNEDLLMLCRLTQEAISKTSGILMHFDAQKAHEVIAYSKTIGGLCASSREYFAGIIGKDEPDGEVLRSLSYGIHAAIEVKHIAGLTEAIVTSLSGLNAELPDSYKINASQFVKIIQNIVCDSVFSLLKKDAALAKKSISAALRLKKVCIHIQENLLKTNNPAESPTKDETVLIFIAQCLKNIAAHAAAIAETALP